MSISSTESYAQQQQIEHPTWLPTLPGYAEVPSNYAEVVVGELIADARENPGFLPTTHSPFGQTNGFQVISPDGTVFVVDNIDEPRCAVFAQYVATGDDENFVMDQGGIVSNVYIENVNFDGCN